MYFNVYFFPGLLSGSLCDTFGCRAVNVMGTLMTVCGLIMGAFAPNIVILYIGYGVITGMYYYGQHHWVIK